MDPQEKGYSEQQKERILRAYRERGSLRGVERIFGVRRETVSRWPGKKGCELKPLAETLASARPEDVLELDEAWSFVGKKENKRWLPAALCRRTGQVVAFAIGDRSSDTCARLWKKIPESYRSCQSFSDFWKAYGEVFSSETHETVDKSRQKERGDLSHGALLLHAAPKAGPLRPKDPLVFEIGDVSAHVKHDGVVGDIAVDHIEKPWLPLSR
jgi:IS1 family transposase